MKAEKPTGLSLEPVVAPRASDVLAQLLREQILTGELSEGTALPVERVLATSVGLSRGTVRDALRVLEVEGLVVTRPGRAGGSFVRRPDASILQRSLDVLVSGGGTQLNSLLEIRESLEPAAARLAALNRTDEDIDRLKVASEAMHESLDDVPQFLYHNVEWHVAVSAASHNEIMHAILVSLSRAIRMTTDNKRLNTPRTMAETLIAHDRVLTAIVQQDPERAASAMARHVLGFRDLLESYAANGSLAVD